MGNCAGCLIRRASRSWSRRACWLCRLRSKWSARNILQAITVRTTANGGASGQELEVANWIGSSLSLAVDPYIPVIATTANGNTSWFLFASPATGNPAIEVAFLSGFATPVVYQRVGDSQRVGDGLDQEAGSFDTMSNSGKASSPSGVGCFHPRATVASNGSGAVGPWLTRSTPFRLPNRWIEHYYLHATVHRVAENTGIFGDSSQRPCTIRHRLARSCSRAGAEAKAETG